MFKRKYYLRGMREKHVRIRISTMSLHLHPNIDRKRLAQVMHLWTLKMGSHKKNTTGDMCVMEAAAYIAGRPWSDSPPCVSPVIAAFMRNWNDSLPTDADRDRLLKPLIPTLIDTKSSNNLEQRRSFMALD